jgi:hypothetical protein
VINHEAAERLSCPASYIKVRPARAIALVYGYIGNCSYPNELTSAFGIVIWMAQQWLKNTRSRTTKRALAYYRYCKALEADGYEGAPETPSEFEARQAEDGA